MCFTTESGQTPPGGEAQKGLPDAAKRLRVQAVTDGLSKTMLIEEDAGRPTYFIGSGAIGPKTKDYNHKQDVANGIALGAGWAQPNNRMTLHGTQPDGLTDPGTCFMNCTNNNELYSFHTNGVNILFADSSCRFVTEDSDPKIFAATVTRSGGELGELP